MTTHRRRFLRLCGVVGISSIAGCSDGSQNTETPTPSDTTTAVKSPTATLTPSPDRTPTPSGTATPTQTQTETSASAIEQDNFGATDAGNGYELFGQSVKVSSDGTTALIGAVLDGDPNGDGDYLSNAGSAYIFELTDSGYWSQEAKLTADDADSDDELGSSVALSSDGTTALIGAHEDEDPNGENAGSAYVFDGTDGSWSQQAKLTADDGDSEDYFGSSVALSSDGTTALIGAENDEDPNGGSDSTLSGGGSAYVFESTDESWSQQAKLVADDGDSGDIFGMAVALSSDGTTAVIGAYGDEDPNGEEAGAAYVFDTGDGSWTQQAKLTANDGDSYDNFGSSVAVSSDGTTAIIDASRNDRNTGSAYVFDGSGGTWSQQAKLTADDGDDDDYFGSSVALSGDATTALIGAEGDEHPNGQNAGSAYVFEGGDESWTQEAKLAADDGDSDDYFGRSVALSSDGSTGLIGASGDEQYHDENSGSAYVFDL